MTTQTPKITYLKSMHGIGDQLYQLSFVDLLHKQNPQDEIYIQTVLPQLYIDLLPHVPLKFVQPPETYRTQKKALDQYVKDTGLLFEMPPVKYNQLLEPFYSGEDLLNTSIPFTMAKKFKLDDKVQDLKWGYDFKFGFDKVEQLIGKIPKKIAIVRPSTIRKEWVVLTRSPKPNYISWCAKVLQEAGYFVISIADLKPNEEWLENNETPPADLYLHSGELGIIDTLKLIASADICVGGSGFIIPAAVQMGTPLFTIFGGRMAYDSPYKVFHPSMDMSKIGWAMPDKPCRCTHIKHDCDKTITKLDSDFYNFLSKIQ
ncbi:hypothetical protein [Synechococcus phage BUCT-ZZ01]|nr:hypothetical protein [Synechococcus phage BUCT-ZZ01]